MAVMMSCDSGNFGRKQALVVSVDRFYASHHGVLAQLHLFRIK